MGILNRSLLAATILATSAGVLAVPKVGAAANCGTTDTITVAQVSWFSASVMAYVTQTLLEEGYGCEVQLQLEDTVSTASTMLVRGERDIAPEFWVSLAADVWAKIEKPAKYFVAGELYTDGAVLGWWIPDYLAKAHPELKSLTDLRENWELFVEPGESNVGRLYNGPPGWGGSVVTANLFKALDLGERFELFSTGSGANLRAAITRKVAEKKPFVTFYWEPTEVISLFNLVRLDTPPYDAKNYACLSDPDCTDPRVSGWSESKINVVVASSLKQDAPLIVDYLSQMQIPNDVMNEVLAWGDSNSASYQDTANLFLKTYPHVWTQWVPTEVAERVKARLN